MGKDVAHNEALLKERGKLKMPVLALGGDKAFGRGIDTLQSMQRVAEDVRGGVVEDCGHWVQEEQPQQVIDAALEFFAKS